MAVLAPESPKAATLDGQDVVHATIADIAKWEDGPDGSLYVYGKATTPEVDTDEQIVSGDFSGKALREWLETAPALRVQHNGQRDPAGSGIKVEINRDGDGAHWVKGVVDEPVAQRLVRKGHLRAFSVGIASPVVERDMTGKARGGIISGGRIVEVSLVDSPANRSCFLEMAKADKSGQPEFTGTLTATEDVLAKVAEPKMAKTVTVELPKNMRVSVKPSDLAKLATFKKKLVTQTADAVQPPAPVVKTAEPDAAKRDFQSAAEIVDAVTGGKGYLTEDEVRAAGARALAELESLKSAEATVYKRDIDTATRRRLAGEGKALPNLSYPIENAEDLGNAATLARSGHGDVKAARRLIARRAKELGVKNPLKGSDKIKVAKSASAKPQVTKCGCNNGMMGGKPCPDCKKGRKKAKRMVAKALTAPPVTKKKKALCEGCGAMQSRKHAMCTECGKPMAGAPPVVKNHDHMCLGCGKAPLDKGEKHCPGCGKENPGYLPVADHKIPMNADKAAKPGKERVSDDAMPPKGKKGKGGKKGKKPNPFGDKQAPPFGKKDDEKPAKAEKRKGKGKGRKPTEGVTGTPPSEGLPAHREPDGAPIEMFEHTTNLEDGDQHEEMQAAMRHKALGAQGLSQADALLHDLTCPAFAPADVAKAFPYATLGQLDDGAWRQKMLDDAASAPLEQAGQAMALWQHAVTLKSADPELLADLRAGQHGAFLAANKGAFKAFRDATPGPGSFPTPGHMTPQSCRRPYIHEGHAAPSPMHDAPHSFNVPEGQPSAEQYTRDLITAGHGADSPSNDTPRHEPQPAPMTPGKPDRVYYRGTMRDNARQAMTAMHDHISRVFPDVCPMSPEITGIQKPAPPVPMGVGGPEPHSAKAAKAAKRKARKAAKAMAAKRRRLTAKVLEGKITLTSAQKALGIPVAAKKRKPRKPAAVVTKAAVAPPLDAETLKAAVTEATAPLLERVARQDKVLRKQRKTLDAIASQPDTSQAPMRGVAMSGTTKTSAAAQPVNLQARAELAQENLFRVHMDTWRNDPDPGAREVAWAELNKMIGTRDMTAKQT